MYLRRMRSFSNLLGNPDRGMKYVHVTGTAGKGSVANLMQRVLMAQGYRTGLFTSPFVTTTIEKIKVNDLYISPNEFADLLERVKPAIDKAYAKSPYGGPAYFEVLIAMGFLYFKRQKCDWAILEVGMGGRFDATNVIENKQASIITKIKYYHNPTFI